MMVGTHEKVGQRFEEAGLSVDRFVSVKDGEKMCVDHDTRFNSPVEVPGENYGIYADEDDSLVVLDVDDHNEGSFEKKTIVAIAALSGLPRTLKMKSPHVPEDETGGHRIYKLVGEKTPAELFKERFGKKNPVASWGEVVAKNKYVVGAGSELDSCDKDWHDCSEPGEGQYKIKNDREIAEIEPEELIEALAADPDLTDKEKTDPEQEEVGRGDGDEKRQNNRKTVEREFSREEIEDMLDHIPGNQHFDDWIRTGYAVYDWDDGDAGKEAFEQWSRDNRKWEETESQRQIDYIWKNGERASDDPDDLTKASVGTLVYLAKEHGWKPQHQSGSDETHNEIGPKNPAGQLVEDDGCYGYWDEIKMGDEKQTVWKQVANFTLETLEFVKTDESEEIRICVHPAHPAEDPYEVTVEPTVFNEARSFKKEVVIGRTTQFESQHTDTLNELRLTVGAQPAPERTGVAHLGAASVEMNEFVTPGGVLTADGWTDDPDHRYYAKASSDSGDESIVGEKWNLHSDDGDEFDVSEVRTVLKNLPNSRLPGRALSTLGWFYAAPAKPLIHDEEGEFNHLHVRGKTESGKTSFLQVVYEAFGMKGEPWGASATTFSLEQLHAGSRGVPVWIDEYKPSEIHSNKIDTLHDFLRKATKESTRPKGRQDQTFMSFRLQSPVVLSGEQQVSEPAVRRRMIQVNLSERATTEFEHVKAYSELAGETYEDESGTTRLPSGANLTDHALAYYQFLLSCDADMLREVWSTARRSTQNILDELDMTLQDSESQGAQTVVFGYRLYRRFADEMGLSETELPGEDALYRAIEHMGENVGANGQRREHGDEFLELFAQAVNAGYIYGSDEANEEDGAAGYRIYDPTSTPDEALAVHLPTAYPGVKKYAREFNIEDDYNLLAKSDYDDEFADLAESEDTHVAKASHVVKFNGSAKRCVLLDPYSTSDRLGADFDLSAFGLSSDSATDDSEPDESEEVPFDALPLTDAAESLTGYVTVTVTIVDVESYGEGESTTTKAILEDESGAMDLVTWDDSVADRLEELEGRAVVIQNAEVGEHGGTRQLQRKDGLTDIQTIQKGVGHTKGSTPEANQSQIASTATDGGNGPVDAKGKVRDYIINQCEKGDGISVSDVAGAFAKDLSPDSVETALETIQTEDRLLEATGDGWEVLE